MSRYRNNGPRDTESLPDGEGEDGIFIGVNMRVSPEKLPEGMLAKAVNKRLQAGRADTRRGLLELAPQEIGAAALGACVFSNPSGSEGLAVATASVVYIIRDGGPPLEVALPDGVTLTGDIWLEQAFDYLILFRGEELTPLEWNGEPAGMFEEVSQAPDGTGTLPIPGADRATAFLNRLFVPYREGNRRDSVLVSDDLDYTNYVAQLSQFRINFGTSDDIVQLRPFGRATLVCFKGSSIAYWTNLQGDMTDAIAAEITRENGLTAPRAVAQIGGELWFLGRGGVYKVVPGADDKLLMGEETVSAAMQPFFDQVNWRAAGNSLMAVDEERLYVVVPYGQGMTRNNAVAVYNHTTGQWEGYDTFAPSVDCLALLETNYLGRRRLWWVDRSGRVAIMNQDLGADWWDGEHHDIADEMVTRGYYGKRRGRKRFSRVEVVVSTWRPSLSITAGTDGPGEETAVVSDLTTSRTTYATLKAPYTATNTNDDHGDPYRGDYSVQGSDNLLPKSGFLPEQHAEQMLRRRVLARGDYLQVTIANAEGSCRVRRVAVEAIEADHKTQTYS